MLLFNGLSKKSYILKIVLSFLLVGFLILFSQNAKAENSDNTKDNLYEQGQSRPYVSGHANGNFAPKDNLTRAEFAQMLFALLSTDEDAKIDVTNILKKYSDIDSKHWGSQAVAFVTEKNYFEGYNNQFRPNDYIARAEICQVLYNIAAEHDFDFADIKDPQVFGDKDQLNNSWANYAIDYAINKGFVKGYLVTTDEDGEFYVFLGTNNLNRGEAVTVINRFFARTNTLNNSADLITFSDVAKNHWAYNAILNAANGNDFAVKQIAVEKVLLSPVNLEIVENQSYQMDATVLPSNATNKNVSWQSSDKNIATVDKQGQVKAHKEGIATIYVITEDGSFKAEATITVILPKAVKGLKLNPEELLLSVGAKSKLSALIEPVDATNKNINWQSSDENIVTVDKSGNLQGLKAGQAKITATTEDGNFIATANITVRKVDVPTTGINLNINKLMLKVGASEELKATIWPNNATEQGISWHTEDFMIATVDKNGKITALSPGTVTIIATTVNGGYTAKCEVEVAK